MEITITKHMYEHNPKLFAQYGLDKVEDWRWKRDNEGVHLYLSNMTKGQCQKLLEQLEPMAKVKGTGVVMGDIRHWLAVLAGGAVKPRKLRHFADLVTEILKKAPKHWLYRKDDKSGTYVAWFVERVTYHPPQRGHGGESPPYVSMNMYNQEFGTIEGEDINFSYHQVMGKYPLESLAERGLYVETPELLEQYNIDVDRYNELWDKVGLQCLADGTATDDLDGNPKSSDSWYWRSTNTHLMAPHGERSRVVIDVFKEDTSSSENRRHKDHVPGSHFWMRASKKSSQAPTVDTEDNEDDYELEHPDEALEAVHIPVNPNVAIFDMRRHLRLRAHIANLEVYEYDTGLGERLVIPQDVREMVDMLLEPDEEFKDIVGGKGGGSIILSAGPPGTGKTLTAEVYSQVASRPLYTIQASQLGTDPDSMEEELLKVFARSQRWNAILLIDEADVYVRTRGDDLQQNAIVGVWLRVLEYYHGVMFLTTNRSDLVDDAIASRCVARFDYSTPPLRDQAKIWAILARTADIKLPIPVIKEIIEKHQHLSGRDIKNILKLARRRAKRVGKDIDLEVVDFVKKFKPTKTGEPKSDLENALDGFLEEAERARRNLK
jgi:DNA polymerase III delta prime subunit